MRKRPLYEIEDDIELPADLQRREELDAKAIAGITCGYYTSPYKAALVLASQYKPEYWKNKTEDQQNNYVKNLAKRYINILNKLTPNPIDVKYR